MLDKFPEITAEAEGIERTGDDIAKPEHPAGGKSCRTGKGFYDEGITASGFWIGRSQLGVTERGQESDQPVEEKGEQSGRPRFPGRNSGQNENARADHRPDADHGGVEKSQCPGKGNLSFRMGICPGGFH